MTQPPPDPGQDKPRAVPASPVLAWARMTRQQRRAALALARRNARKQRRAAR